MFFEKLPISIHKIMDPLRLRIISIGLITRNVLQIFTVKPHMPEFIPGQAADISINKDGWQNEKRPFTFTSLPDDEFLQFTIKTYPQNKGVTNELLSLKRNDELIIHEVFGAIVYKGEGTFIAGGAGVTPFISIFRYLASTNAMGDNRLIFANKTMDDIILKYELNSLLGRNFINILSDEAKEHFFHGHINHDFLKEYLTGLNKHVYLCGPPPMMDSVEKILSDLNFDERLLVKEAV